MKSGAGDGIRTRNPQLGKLMRYRCATPAHLKEPQISTDRSDSQPLLRAQCLAHKLREQTIELWRIGKIGTLRQHRIPV